MGHKAKFAVGDRVVVTQKIFVREAPTCNEAMVKLAGRESTVLTVRPENGWVILEDTPWVWHPDWLEHAHAGDDMTKAKTKFAVGDTVVIVDIDRKVENNPGFAGEMVNIARDGKLRTVLAIHAEKGWVQLTEATYRNTHTFWWHPDWLEHIHCEMI